MLCCSGDGSAGAACYVMTGKSDDTEFSACLWYGSIHMLQTLWKLAVVWLARP